MPQTGGIYGGYVGEIGTWTNWQGCTSGRALNATYANQANADEPWPGWGPNYPIPGVFFYWYMAGPGADPAYNGTTSEAYNWGWAQAQRAAAQYPGNDNGITTQTTYAPLMFMDIEKPLTGSNGWNHETNTCGAITGNTPIPYAVDRATFNGFYNYIFNDSQFYPGVYSSPQMWCPTFGSCPAYGYNSVDGAIPNVYEWTSETNTNTVTPNPVGFCQSGHGCAQWFGEVGSSYNTAWQWYQSATADFSQWNVANLP